MVDTRIVKIKYFILFDTNQNNFDMDNNKKAYAPHCQLSVECKRQY